MTDFDCVIAGGGVAGLTTALRLAGAGWRVALADRDRPGAGATLSNHGIVHSGALFAQLHPEVVRECYAAQAAYVASFPACVVDTPAAWYLASAQRLTEFQQSWDKLNIPHEQVDRDELAAVLRAPAAAGQHAAAVKEVIISTYALIAELAARCRAAGVEMMLSAPVVRVTASGTERIVAIGGGGAITAREVVLCTGIGTRALLEASGSKLGGQLKSRLDMMMSFPNLTLDRAVLGLEYGWPTIAPALGGTALASRYGAKQPAVRDPGRWPVPVSEAASLVAELTAMLQPGLVDFSGGHGWVCSKTEFGAGASDAWGVEPNYAVIDHAAAEGIPGLWTILPGKMTLALHASQNLATRLTDTGHPLALLPPAAPPLGERPAVAENPWAHGVGEAA